MKRSDASGAARSCWCFVIQGEHKAQGLTIALPAGGPRPQAFSLIQQGRECAPLIILVTEQTIEVPRMRTVAKMLDDFTELGGSGETEGIVCK